MSHDNNDNQRFDTDPNFGGTVDGDQLIGDGNNASNVVSICKKCMVSQPGDGSFCIQCGEALVPIRAIKDSFIGDTIGDKYKIVEQIGVGGMGEVYLGVNTAIGQRVAIKFLSKRHTSDEQVVMRFVNEARSCCKVNHPNAVTLLDYGQHDDGSLYIITEFVDGKDLGKLLKEQGPLPLSQVLSIATQLCGVLSAAHGQGVIHRDLKPDNIMLIPVGRGRYAVKVLDFGIAKIMDDDRGPMTETGSIFGTPEFMSPEQACGDSADPRSDIYALGIILFYMLTGKLPFRGDNKLAVLHKHLHDQPPRPSSVRDDLDIPFALDEVVLKCLKKRPDNRYESADELSQIIEELQYSHTAGHSTKLTSVMPAAKKTGTNDSASDDKYRGHDDDDSQWDDSYDDQFMSFVGDISSESELYSDDFHAEFDDSHREEESEDEAPMANRMRDWQRKRTNSMRGKRQIALVAVILLGLFGVGMVFSFADKNNTGDNVDGPIQQLAKLHPTEQLTQYITQGQLDTATKYFEDINSSDEIAGWNDEYREQWKELVAVLDSATTYYAAMESALNSRECDKARQASEKLVAFSAQAATNAQAKIDACVPHPSKASKDNIALTKTTPRSAPRVKTAPPESPAPVPSQKAKTPASETPQKPEVSPVPEAEPSKPDVETPPPAPAEKPKPITEPEADTAPDGPDVPDGMALPPKTL